MMKPLLTLMAIALLGLCVPAQQKAEPCKDLKYENKNQVNPSPLSVIAVSGRVIVEAGELGAAKEIGPVTEACLGLFAEKDHQLVATAVVDDEGRLAFGAVPVGKYRLVVHAGPLCVANVPLRVIRGKRGKESNGMQVVVHMRAAGYDTCSYGDYK